MTPYLHIAIDGPAGAGKSTIAKAVSKALDIPYLDTGAMYRTLALYAIQCGVNPSDEERVATILPSANIRVLYENGQQHMLLNDVDVTGQIRTPEISKGASDIAVHATVRKKLVELQQQVALLGSIVMDGRDIGTVVIPDTPYKFFITASPEVRAKRRLLEMREKGEQNLPTLSAMEQAIRSRDHTDSTRAASPLRQAPDAQFVDTTSMSIDESVAFVLNAIAAQK